MSADPSATLRRLRQTVAKIEGYQPDCTASTALAFGVEAIDAALQGGLARGYLHEVAPAAACDAGSVMGFALALTARIADRSRHVLWIQTDYAALEAGNIHGLGCEGFGLPMRQLLILKVPRPIDVLWAMEEALKCRALKSVIAELPDDRRLTDLAATRRLTLAARGGDAFGFLLRLQPALPASSAETRWRIAAAPSRPDRYGGLGRTAFALSLVKNRHGQTGQWTIAWDHHERTFSALSFGMAQAAFDRPDRTPLVRAG